MPRKKPKNHLQDVQNVTSEAQASYLTFNEDNKQQVFSSKEMSETIEAYSGSVNAAFRTDFSNIGGDGISGRPGLSNSDYEKWRPGEKSRFEDQRYLILESDLCYRRHGLIRNVIDLMGDFACQGIRIVHPNKRIERFYRHLWAKWDGPERSERFLNSLYRLGNVVVRIQTAKINTRIEERLYKTSADVDVEIEELELGKKEIPWQFTFLHPSTIEIFGGALSNFATSPEYGIKLPNKLRSLINAPKTDMDKRIVAQLPQEIRDAAKYSKAYPLPKEKTRVFHYKKDDWQTWADPMIAATLIDISLYEKLKLADRAALDGAISNVRLWILGNLEYGLMPTPAAAAKLAEILQSNTQAGTLDLVWGPDIKLVESNTSVHQFLGEEKYRPTLLALYAGLGIPPTLTGTFGASGTTNNFISLKTLTQRLEYGRAILVKFWTEQLRIVQEVMGFRFPAQIEFDYTNLGDETAEKTLLLQLSDRSVISDELLQRKFGHDPEMERIRINREFKEREAGRMVPKAGPFYEAEFEKSLKKTALQIGIVTPSEVGLELDKKKSGQKTALEFKAPAVGVPGKPAKKKGIPSQGRPKNKGDSKKRKTKTFKPKVKAQIELWANKAQNTIAHTINSLLLEQYGKRNLRELTNEQFEESESVKFGILCNLSPMSECSAEAIYQALEKSTPSIVLTTLSEWNQHITGQLGRTLTLDERKHLQSAVYATYIEKLENDKTGVITNMENV